MWCACTVAVITIEIEFYSRFFVCDFHAFYEQLIEEKFFFNEVKANKKWNKSTNISVTCTSMPVLIWSMQCGIKLSMFFILPEKKNSKKLVHSIDIFNKSWVIRAKNTKRHQNTALTFINGTFSRKSGDLNSKHQIGSIWIIYYEFFFLISSISLITFVKWQKNKHDERYTQTPTHSKVNEKTPTEIR